MVVLKETFALPVITLLKTMTIHLHKHELQPYLTILVIGTKN